MALSLLLLLLLLSPFVKADCHGDNCANHVTGTFAGIGVPMATRVSLCNDFLAVTIRPATTTITKTVTIYNTRQSSSSSSSTITPPPPTTATAAAAATTDAQAVPTFATSQCPGDGQFASACRCWTLVTARTATLTQATLTITTTVSADVACGPAATAVTDGTRFPCSGGNPGMCSCLRSADGDNVCVRVGDEGLLRLRTNVTGPCAAVGECPFNGSCAAQGGGFCVFDDSCACGKRRCYRPAPGGCRGPGFLG